MGRRPYVVDSKAGQNFGEGQDIRHQPGSPESCRWKSGASRPRTVDVTSTITPASADEYHLARTNGLLGSANAQAAYAIVPAAISQTGHCVGRRGICFCPDLSLTA